jgi:hypothetical protein
MVKFYKNIIWIVLGLACVVVFVKSCDDEDKIVTKTEIKYIKVIDTVVKTVISEPKTVYINKYKTIKGNDSIVYVSKTDSTTVKANQYDTKLESNNATADLKITVIGELLDVSGIITYENKETTTTITKTKAKSGVFIYGNVPINSNLINVEVGLLYQIKNKLIIMGGVQYNQFTKSPDIKVGIGIKL